MRTRLSATGRPTAFGPITPTMPSVVRASTRYQWPLSSAACGEAGPATSCPHSAIVVNRVTPTDRVVLRSSHYSTSLELSSTYKHLAVYLTSEVHCSNLRQLERLIVNR